MADLFDCDVELNVFDHLWTPVEHDGWTWVQTMPAAPETYSLFDASGELMGVVYQRYNRVICWAPFTWAEEAYRREEDVGEYGFDDDGQRRHHLAKIGAALRDWVRRKREDGVDIPLLRDTHDMNWSITAGAVRSRSALEGAYCRHHAAAAATKNKT